ncbi:hypothetical protein [Lactiplantibacillus pentosus]|uniref:hypothetical protein n=1 Tax=Lactiplantibacillus pentosus TaxID=1589 RepID=UPI0015E5F5C7|nr:hypothetical protein [Lactiplantibacillus pentosus]
MNMTAFWITWFVLSALMQLELNHRASLKLKRMQNRISEMQQVLREENKGDK